VHWQQVRDTYRGHLGAMSVQVGYPLKTGQLGVGQGR
jgi:hypothetical protein